MNAPPHASILAAVGLLGLLGGGCESDNGIAARTREKSAAYASLQDWQKTYISRGEIAAGFSPDMVYMVMGSPTRVETKDLPEGRAELWTYRRYYPETRVLRGFHYDTAPFTTESVYQTSPPALVRSSSGRLVPRGMGLPQSIATTGPPQGTMEPADLRSYTCWVLYRDGKVARLIARVNPD